MTVIPYVQPRIIEKDQAVNYAGPDNFAHDLPVDKRAGTLICEYNLHQGAETLGDFPETRILCRFRHSQPVQKRCRFDGRIPNHEAQCHVTPAS
ncbi:hypothetical protein [Paraburkholderia hospita]|jgi:hypothetical protein|uniref:hypothetical protein n=1 Tax=Paraburkholderia hospita TaxID=169430 RepID=UPI00126013EC|nr:hypothetical protein [Paraburkholderia hospita]